MSVQFPEGFRFGTATAAFQIEGAARADGKQDSIWDVFCREPGRVVNGDDGTVACDHFHLFESDVNLMSDLGMGTYRFSVSWPRVYNDGAVNDKGMDFYSRLVDALLEKGIAPWLTLYHWDLPAALPGGWTNRDTAYRFADYAAAVHQRLGDRVATWTTLNEPWCSAFLGYASGVHAPGQTDASASIRAAHHLMLGHGLATQALRAADPRAKLGITLNFTPVLPATHEPDDIDVARRIDGTANRFFADAIFKGRYPGDVVADAGEFWPEDLVVDGDLEVISTPIDVLGVNYYTTNMFAAGSAVQAPPSPHVTAPTAVQKLRDLPLTDMGWEVEPSGLTRLLVRLHQDYTGPVGTEVVITENGAAFPDRADANGFVDDSADRLEYLRRHLLAAHQAIQAGVNLRGYLVWSLMDNFEWAWGYGKRFGIVRVDEKLRRIPKASARWYAEVARTGAVPTVPPPPPDDALPTEDDDSPVDEPTVELDGGEPTQAAPQAMTAVPPPVPQAPQTPQAPQLPQLPRSPWSADAAPGMELVMAVPPPSVPQPPQVPPTPQPPSVPQLPRSPWSADAAPGMELVMAVPPPSVPQPPQAPPTPQVPQLPRSPWSADPAPASEAVTSPASTAHPHLPASPWSADLPASMDLPIAAPTALPASPWSAEPAPVADTDATVIQLIYSRTPPESPASSASMR
jgi:beta-glucosidase